MLDWVGTRCDIVEIWARVHRYFYIRAGNCIDYVQYIEAIAITKKPLLHVCCVRGIARTWGVVCSWCRSGTLYPFVCSLGGKVTYSLPRPDIDPNFLLLNLPCFLTAPEVFSWLYDEYKVISGYLVGMDELCL
jgi:hypothetical protein